MDVDCTTFVNASIGYDLRISCAYITANYNGQNKEVGMDDQRWEMKADTIRGHLSREFHSTMASAFGYIL